MGVRDVSPGDAGEADHHQRRPSVRVRTRAAREPGAALREQLLLRLQQLSGAWRAADGRARHQGERHAARARRLRRRGGQERPLHRRGSSGLDRRLVTARLHDRRPQLLPRQSPQPAVQRSSSRSDDSTFLVGEGSHSGGEVHDHQDADARDLGDEGHGDSVQSPQRVGQMGDQPERQAVSRR